MITLIGKKRAVFLGIAILANMAAVSVYLLLVEPMKLEEEMNLQRANTRISKLSTDIENIKREMRDFPDNYALYQNLEKQGFYSVQDRFEAGRLIDGLRPRSGLLGYTYRIDAQRQMEDPQAAAAKAGLIASRISIDNISSVLDSNVFAFLREIEHSFPQHTRIDRFDLTRNKDVDASLLKKIAEAPVPALKASVTFDWFTVVPEDALPDEGKPGGFRGR